MSNNQQFKIDSESHYNGIKAILNKQSQKPGILRALMRAMEAYRSARKYGWSRPWNKYGVMNTMSYRIRPTVDLELIYFAQQLMETECSQMPEGVKVAVHDLLHDREKLMGFLFVQECTDEDGMRYEGINISFGRVNDKRYRDRVDIILESPIQQFKSQGLGRIRVYVDPYNSERKDPLWVFESTTINGSETDLFFQQLAAISWEWAGDKSRIWDHWTSRYIDYFGPRQWQLEQTYFYHPDNAPARIETQLPAWASPEQTQKAC